MAASPNLGTATPGHDCHPSIPTAQQEVGDQYNIHLPTQYSKQQTHQLTSQLGNHAGIVDPQAVVDRPPPEAHGVPSAQTPHA